VGEAKLATNITSTLSTAKGTAFFPDVVSTLHVYIATIYLI
jgi:hypothetical protein